MRVNAENALRFLEKWQAILRLRDWDIRYEPVRVPWRKTGDIKIDRDDKKAVLMINCCNPKQDNLEALIIHELLHLKLWDMDQMIEGLIDAVYGDNETDPKRAFAYNQFMTALEPTVEDLAKGFLSIAGEDQHISFGRVMRQVEREICASDGRALPIETERLRLIPMDFGFFDKLIYGDASAYGDVGAAVSAEWPRQADIFEGLSAIREDLRKKPVPDGFDAWLIVRKADQEIVGDAGFKGSPDADGAIDLGYGILASQRRNGYAYEAAEALLKWGFAQSSVRAVTADCLEKNTASARILAKLGMLEIRRENGMIYFRKEK